jgi:hypothetical protein
MTPFNPWLPASTAGQVPGVIQEGLDPNMIAAMGAPLPASGDFRIGSDVQQGAPSAPMPPQENFLMDGLPGAQPLPDQMSGINRALAQNQELADVQPRGGFGQFLAAWAGHLGDALTETPAYAKSVERADKSRQQEKQQMLLRHALINAGVPASHVPLLLANPEAIGTQFATRLATRNVDEGSSVHTPNPDGSANVFTSPKTFNEGADVVQSPALNMNLGLPPARPGVGQMPSQPRRIGGLRTEAEQYADTVAERGTSEWGSAVRDFVLKANGPTANAHDRDIWGQRLDVTRRGQDVTRRGQDIGSRDRRRGQDITDSRVRGSASYQGRGGKGGAKRSDLIGPVYRKGGRQIQYSKGAGGYVDVETGQRVQ